MKRKPKKVKTTKRSLLEYRKDNIFFYIPKALAHLDNYKDGWINSTGNCVKSDYVIFARAYYKKKGKKRRIKYCEIIEGLIIDEFYDSNNFVHFFKILRSDSKRVIQITGATLYRFKVLRKIWTDEELRKLVVNEKIIRGDIARFDKMHKLEQQSTTSNV